MADPGPGEQARAQAARTSPVFLTLAGLLFLGIVTLPCALGYALHPAGTVFLGFVEDWPDTLNYFSFVEQARHGHALAALSAGPSPGKTYLFSSLCYLMGLLCRLTGLEPPEAHLLTRLVFAALLVPALWWFLRDALEDGPAARFALLSILFGSGFGFLVPPGSEVLHPTDLWHVGTIAIYACASLAHLAASWWTLVLAYLCLGRAFERDSLRWAVAGGAALAANGSLHPYHFVSACAVAALAAGVEGPSRRSFALAAGFLGTGGLAFGVQLYLVVSQPLMREVAAQSMNLSPPPWDYLLGFGLAGVLGLAALVDWRYFRDVIEAGELPEGPAAAHDEH
ncbi:MAG: hypothetical protein HY303_16990, partial [Candidatus Wallbacteria bacterium]|nr:hypothetical protein [Candidatus Wallbacteria bacterium]